MNMDGSKTANSAAAGASERNGRRRRWEMTSENVRYYLPKPGSSSDRPELGQEVNNEGEALVQSFKSGEVFYTVVAWRAATEINGNEPKIVKQALSRS
jgi:hypothetical protein